VATATRAGSARVRARRACDLFGGSPCLSGFMLGQELYGSIVGTVKDSAGAVVPGATVTISDPSKDNRVVRTLTTNENGEFTAATVPISSYNITVEAANFKKSISTGVKVDVGQRRNVEIELTAGDIAEVVTIEADRVSVELNTPTVGTVINGDQARELPINNRNFVQLLTLAPGVSSNLADQVYVGTTNPDGQANVVAISVNGARSSQNTFTVDGADITDRGSNITIQAYPSVDSIGEFRVLRSMYPAESGRSGGGQVNVITRSGGDKFHGNFFEFVRNEKLNANTYFNNQTQPRDADGKAIRPPFRYNNYGLTVGGPVYFLNFGNLDSDEGYFGRIKRTYFFYSLEHRDDIRFPALSSTVPTAALKQGVFPAPICLQATGAVCNTVLNAGTPIGPINPISQQYINFIWNNVPTPNNPGSGPFALSFPTRGVSKFRQNIFKLDTGITKDWTAYYRLQLDKIPTQDANSLFSSGSGLPGVSLTETNSPGRTHTFNSTYVATPNLVFEAGYTFGYGAILSKNIGLIALANSPITPPLPYPVQRDRVPTLTGTGFSNLQSFGPYDNFSWKQNLSGATTWINGNHTIKFGGIYSLYRKNENALAGSNEGIYSGFNTPGATAATVAPTCTTVTTAAQCTQLQQWANFLLGTNANFTQASFDYTADLRQKTFEAFVQDEWKFRPNLTLYMGVRYSFFGSPYDKNGRLTNFVPELWTAAQAPLVTGAGNRVAAAGKNFCNGIIANTQNYLTGPANFNCTPIPSPFGKFVVDAPKTDFAPRVGLAWDPFKNGETSVRMGYGIYHDQVLNGTLLQQIGLNPPYQQTCTVTGINIANPVPGGNCAVAAAATAPNVRALQADWKTPYMQHWSLDVQRQLTSNTIVTVGYYGSKGTHLIGAFEANELPAGYAASLGPTACATGASTTPTAPCQVPGVAFLSAAATTILDQLRPYRGFRSVNIVQTRYNSDYHSMQVFGQHRFSGSSQVNLAYTWSKNLSDNQTDRSTAPQDSFNIKGDYGRAQLDRRHILTTNWVYDLPFFNNTRGPVGLILGGWQFQGIATYQTGLPLTVVTSAFDPAGLGFIPALIAGGRPNILCNPNAGGAQTQQQWFDTSCFVRNPTTAQNVNIPSVVGTSPRGVVNGPANRRVDFVMSKNFNFSEDMRLQLRAESFNVFNWTNFNAVSVNVTAANFGAVTSARDPRTFQFGAKFYW
jgi:hypothetical protein